MKRALALVCLACVLVAACGECGAKKAEPPPPAPPPPPPPAVLTGRIKLAPGAALPSYPIEQMELDVLDHTKRGAWPQSCTPPKDADREPVKQTTDGYLSGVMLAPSEFARPSTRPPKVHDVAIRDCRLTPSLVVAMRGDRLRVRNEVDFPFMPSYGKGPLTQTLIPGQSRDYDLQQAGVGAVLCGFTAPCGRTDVITVLHPVYAVTDAEGRFRFDDFPPGETIVLNAWHPLFQQATLEVRVEPGETREVELTLTPATP